MVKCFFFCHFIACRPRNYIDHKRLSTRFMAIAFIYEKKYGSPALQPKEDENIKKAERRWRRVYSENDCKSSRDPQNAAESTDDCYKIHSMLVIATWSEA